jgi:hypothetical protein
MLSVFSEIPSQMQVKLNYKILSQHQFSPKFLDFPVSGVEKRRELSLVAERRRQSHQNVYKLVGKLIGNLIS